MNLSTTFAATMTVLIGMCLLGLFIALGTWVLSWSNHVQKELRGQGLLLHLGRPADRLRHGCDAGQEQAVRCQLSQRPARQERVTFVSKEQALEQMKKTGVRACSRRDAPVEPAAGLVGGDAGPGQVHAAHRQADLPGPLRGRRAVPDQGHRELRRRQWGSTITKRVLTIAKVISLVFLDRGRSCS